MSDETAWQGAVDPQNPQAFAVCDRCRLLYNHVDLAGNTSGVATS